MTTAIDVVVLGGGPAGCATAITSCQHGLSCVIVEKSRFARPRIGETLPPASRRPLASLGVWDSFLATGPSPGVGIRSAWGSEALHDQDFIFNPYGNGWSVNRLAFDTMLADAARVMGVTVMQDAKLVACTERSDAGGWALQVAEAGKPLRELHARFVIDATGRAAAFARSRGATRVTCDRLIGIARSFRAITPHAGPFGPRGPLGTLLVEAVEAGWWYCAPLPDSRLIIFFMTDGDLYARARDAEDVRSYERALARTQHTHACTEGFAPDGKLTVVAGSSGQLTHVCGHGWAAVGDAASTYDPLSGQGIYKALDGGITAAHAIQRHLAGDPAGLRDYEARLRAAFDQYLYARRDYYSREARWPLSAFWQRRRGA